MYDFSIIIPTYNRADSLEQLLWSLTLLQYPSSQFEVIVVDDGGSINLESSLSKFQDSLNILLLQQPNAGPGAARNRGADSAKGRHLAFTDDDCMADAHWLQELAVAFENSKNILCGGRIINRLKDNIYAEASQLLTDYLYQHYNPTKALGAFFPTNNLSVSRDAFVEIGGFDPSFRFGEDRDFCYRWASRGYRFVFAPAAITYHFHRLNLLTFLRLHYSYGKGTCQFRRRCVTRGLKSVKLSPPSWYVNLVLSGIRKEKSALGFLLTLLLICTQVATAAGIFWETVRRPRPGKTREKPKLES